MFPEATISAPVAITARAFFSPSDAGDRGLVDVVSARAATAEVCVGEFAQLDAGNGAQKCARFTKDVLRVRQMAGVLIGDPHGAGPLGSSRRPRRARKTLTSSTRLRKASARASSGRAAQHQMVFVHRRAAAGGVGDDGVHVIGEGVEIAPRKSLRRAEIAGVPRQPAAAALRPAGTTTSTPLRASTSIVAVLMSGSSTCCAQPVSSATRARRSPRAPA